MLDTIEKATDYALKTFGETPSAIVIDGMNETVVTELRKKGEVVSDFFQYKNKKYTLKSCLVFIKNTFYIFSIERDNDRYSIYFICRNNDIEEVKFTINLLFKNNKND